MADCSSKKSLVVLPLVATSMMVAVVALGLLLSVWLFLATLQSSRDPMLTLPLTPLPASALLSHYRSLVEWRIVLHMVLLALLLLVYVALRRTRGCTEATRPV